MPLKRRDVLSLMVGAVSGSALPFNVYAQSQAPQKTAYDVIVIGAGIAGLAAARDLAQKGHNVVVVEARERIGGRIHTDWTLGAPFELGAGWIHGPKGNPISKLAQAAKMNTFVTDDDSLTVFDQKGQAISKKDLAQLDKKLRQAAAAIDDEIEADMPLSKALDAYDRALLKDPLFRWAITAYTEFDTGGAVEKLSAKYFQADEAFKGEDVIPLAGYDKLLAPLQSGFEIVLNNPVLGIDYQAGAGATVKTSAGVLAANFVVCTVPLGVLQGQSIDFNPPLPAKTRKAIAAIGMGSVTKVALKFAKPFWDIETQYLGIVTKQKGRWPYWLNYRTFSDHNILLGLSFGDYAFKADALSDREMVADALDVLRDSFGSAVPVPIGFQTTHWSKDPWAKGAYSFASYGSKPKDFDLLSEPVADVVVLAGEHTDFAYHGTVHGAFLSGVKAAKIIDDMSD